MDNYGGLAPRDNLLQPKKNQWNLLLLSLYYPNFSTLSKILTIVQKRILSMTTGESSFTSNISFLTIVLIKLLKTKFSLSPRQSKFYCTNYILNILLWIYFESVQFIIVHKKPLTIIKFMIHGTYKFSPPQASLLQILHWVLMKILPTFLTRLSALQK